MDWRCSCGELRAHTIETEARRRARCQTLPVVCRTLRAQATDFLQQTLGTATPARSAPGVAPLKHLRHSRRRTLANSDEESVQVNVFRRLPRTRADLRRRYPNALSGINTLKLEKVSTQPIRFDATEVPVVCPIKNEIVLLPHFLRHYRRLGVKQFIFVDNGSNDGSFEFVESQDDCILFRTLDSFRDANYGMDWVNWLLTTYCQYRWCVFVDCDEFLLYRDCENVTLYEFCAELGHRGFNTAFGVMIDTYPEGDFLSVQIKSDTDVFDQMGWFDTDYVLRRWPRRPWDPVPTGFHLQILGGPRCRLLSSLEVERRRGALFYTFCNQVDRVIERVPERGIPWLARMWPAEMPALQKQPINFVTEDFRFLINHGNTNQRYATDLVGLLHFKLCGELQRHLSDETIMANHYRKGLGHEHLRQAALKWGARSLKYEGSRKYRRSDDLATVGLIGPHVSALWAGSSRPAFVRTGQSWA
jgi:hypothetical protein